MAQYAPPFKAILSYPNKTIAQLRLQINQQLATLQRIKTVLPNDLADHALYCVSNNKKLLIYTDSAAWASQIRFYAKAILAVLESESLSLVSMLQVKVIDLPATRHTKPQRKVVFPSQAVADEIRDQSLLSRDPQLKTALDKLSSTLARRAARARG